MSTTTQLTEREQMLAYQKALIHFADRMAGMMRTYELPEECNGIIVGELDVINELCPPYAAHVRLCGEYLFENGKCIGQCSEPWGTEHSHND